MIPTLLLNPRVLIAAGVAGILLALGTWGYTMKLQRDRARIERDQDRLALEGYRIAQAARMEAAKVQIQSIRQQTREQLERIDAKLPTTDEEARRWALQARPKP